MDLGPRCLKRPPNPADPDPLHQPGLLLIGSSSPGLLRLESGESSWVPREPSPPDYSLSGPPWRMGRGSDAVQLTPPLYLLSQLSATILGAAVSQGQERPVTQSPSVASAGVTPLGKECVTRAPWRDTTTTVGPSGERGWGGATSAGEKHLVIEWAPKGVVMSAASHQSTLYIVHVPG